ncbi:hypothetical protein GLOTRDRAFT_110357 [Gloeophyllum trabeum ATCC 11539]|uniref:Uncharacterized protein n=1 Tax=Gloeophyllum trabeum (strain ATCC 11539 / FP-39264 / Madison 617) TaxID=670483 RepID=S7RQT8_GLOTA|nr:uncharacterized protein GLOTRDRAFT_110357 [Gloeophyllum trabeum ATCC 11539]EPQ56940.1 hypothetical protein GLOTRDRAFT_110357 [Gloeophyllum trabeum ATCC 11539]
MISTSVPGESLWIILISNPVGSNNRGLIAYKLSTPAFAQPAVNIIFLSLMRRYR